jgi:hypothetical protein
MIVSKFLRALCFVGLGLFAGGACAPTETGNPSLTPTTASLVAYSSQPGTISVGTTSGARVDRIWISYSTIDLTDCAGSPAESAVTGPIVEELAARPPASHELTTNLQSFCRVDIPLLLASAPLPTGAPLHLENSVLLVEAHRSDDVAVVIRSRAVRHFTLDASPEGVRLDDEPRELLIAFDVWRWFEALDLSGATISPDGSIQIDEASNPALLTAFETGLDQSASLHRDLDRDGELDPGEGRLDH